MSQDLRERCSYLLILFKAKDKALFEKYSAELLRKSAEESTEFYNYLLLEYKKLVEGPQETRSPVKPVLKAETPKPAQKPAKKAAKKTVKKPVKKAAKKTAKKVTKKSGKKK